MFQSALAQESLTMSSIQMDTEVNPNCPLGHEEKQDLSSIGEAVSDLSALRLQNYSEEKAVRWDLDCPSQQRSTTESKSLNSWRRDHCRPSGNQLMTSRESLTIFQDADPTIHSNQHQNLFGRIYIKDTMCGSILLVFGMSSSKCLSERMHWDSDKGSPRSNLDCWLACEWDKMTIVDLCGSHLTRLQKDKGKKDKYRACWSQIDDGYWIEI